MEINHHQSDINNQETFNLNELKCIIDDQTGNLLKIPFCNYERNMTLLRCLLYAKKANKILVGTNHGLYICNPTTFLMENALNPASTDGWFYDRINCTDSYFLLERRDGTILTSSQNGKIKIYDLLKLECIKEIIIDLQIYGKVQDGAELNNGDLIVLFGNDILIYDGNSYEMIKKIEEYKSRVYAVCFMKDYKFITASYDDSRLIFWRKDSNNYIKEHCINDIKICGQKNMIFNEDKNVLIIGFENTISIIDGNKYNVIKTIDTGKNRITHIKCLLLLKEGFFIAAKSNGEIVEYDNQYNLHSQIEKVNEFYHPLLYSITDVIYFNNCLFIACGTHSIKIFKKSNEKTKISKYVRSDYDSD